MGHPQAARTESITADNLFTGEGLFLLWNCERLDLEGLALKLGQLSRDFMSGCVPGILLLNQPGLTFIQRIDFRETKDLGVTS